MQEAVSEEEYEDEAELEALLTREDAAAEQDGLRGGLTLQDDVGGIRAALTRVRSACGGMWHLHAHAWSYSSRGSHVGDAAILLCLANAQRVNLVAAGCTGGHATATTAAAPARALLGGKPRLNRMYVYVGPPPNR